MNEESKMRNERGLGILRPDERAYLYLRNGDSPVVGPRETNVSEELEVIEKKVYEIKEILIPPYKKLGSNVPIPSNNKPCTPVDTNDIFRRLSDITDLLCQLKVIATAIERRI